MQELAGELGDFETGNSRVWGAGLWSRGESVGSGWACPFRPISEGGIG